MRHQWPGLLALALFACDGGDGVKDLVDADGDGALEDIDCDDADASVFPGADEVCDGIDNNCDDAIDDAPTDGVVYYEDADVDGYGGVSSLTACEAPSGYVENSDDCNDNETTAYPGASELCDGLDNDCNSIIDDGAGDVNTYYADLDGDGYGNPDTSLEACSAPSNYVSDNTDCDDTNANLTPDTRWYIDGDGDGYGQPQFYESGCAQPKSYVDNNGDCDDDSNQTYPGAATEAPKLCMLDGDGDGFGSSDPPAGVDVGTDCLDTDSSVFPGAVDEDPKACMQDFDADGFGDDNPVDGVDPGTDCDDSSAVTYPGADEYCNGSDNDCNGVKDDDYALDAVTWYTDSDDDGFGDSKGKTTTACYTPAYYAENTDDCNDSDEDINPDALEDCTDSLDNNCNGETDESCTYGTDSADVTITGAASYEYSGTSFTGSDVNGDGYEDLIVGAYAAESYRGRTSVFFGPLSAGDYTMKSDEDITFVGGASTSTSGYSGWSVESGDLDGDGYDDMLIAAYYDSYVTSYAGSVYILYGPQTSGALTAADADAVVHGKSSYDYLGYYSMSVYDIDDDGDDDAMIGAYSYDGTGGSSTGAIGVFDVPVGNVQIDSGESLFTGKDTYDYVGYSIGDVGDVDNDGYADVGWGEPGDSAAYLMFGPFTAGSYDSDDADVIIQGSTSSSGSGYYTGSEMAGGDFNGDGYADTAVGAMYDYVTTSYQGSLALFYGPLSGTVSYGSDYDFRFYDVNANNYIGSPYYGNVSVGDLDADGKDDLFITNMYNEDVASYGGAGFILYGPMTGDATTKEYDAAIYGNTNSYLGRHDSLLSDLDGNGSLDVVIASYYSSSYAGETYVFFDDQF
jgi:hypothetical protein